MIKLYNILYIYYIMDIVKKVKSDDEDRQDEDEDKQDSWIKENLKKKKTKKSKKKFKKYKKDKVKDEVVKVKDKVVKVKKVKVKKNTIDLKGKTVKELYDLYERYVIELNNTDDNKEKDDIKQIIQDIRIELDNIDLDDEQLNELYSRQYQGYPDYNNPNFNTDISRKIEFNSNKIYFDQQTTCGKKSFELGNHQRMLKNFMNKRTPYKSLLIFHGVGVGKTCSAVKISESFRDLHSKDNNKIIVLRKGGLGEGWKNTIFDPSKGENQCSGQDLINLIDRGSGEKEEKTIKRDVNKIINKYYDFYAYRKFSNIVEELIKNSKTDEEVKYKIKEKFSNRLLIVDEYHNLRGDGDESNDDKQVKKVKDGKQENKEEKKALQNLLKIIKYSDNLRLILLTATPMFNYSDEIFNLLNVLLINDNRPKIDYKRYIENGNINQEGLEVLSKKFRGYVSYLRGENPTDFPIRIYPNDYGDPLALTPENAPKKDLFGIDIDDELKFLNTYDNKLQGKQKESYEILLKKLDQEKKIGIGDSNLTQICNVYYPSKREQYGKIGFESVFSGTRKFKYRKGVPEILSPKLLKNHSIKINNIIENITNSEGIIFIYSEYIYAGALPLGIALEHIGFNKYGSNNLLNSSSDGKVGKAGNYIILSGDTNISENNDEEIKVVTSPENKDGNIIKVIIGSSITGEGMDFKNIRQIHVLDPWWHLSKLEQIIGRGIRYCSHVLLPEDERNVTVFLHTATCDGNETVDHYNYRRGEKKSMEIGKVETILKGCAYDCYLFKGANIIKKDKKIDVNVSRNGIPNFQKSISDKPYTKICSYQPKCDYECINDKDTKYLDNLVDLDKNSLNIDDLEKDMEVSFTEKKTIRYGKVKEKDKSSDPKRKNHVIIISKRKKYSVPLSKIKLNTINYDTIDFKYFDDLKKNIIVYLNEIYSDNKFNNLNYIVEYIQKNKKINTNIIYNLLKKIIDGKDKIYDENNLEGYLLCKNNFYIFQPVYNNDDSVPIFYRNNINNKNRINVDLITDNIKSQLDNLIELKVEEDPEIDKILTELKSNYKKLLSKNKSNLLHVFKLIEDEFKDIYLESCLDELSYDEKKALMKHVIKGYNNDGVSNGELTDDEIIFLSYEYYKNNFIQKVGDKYTLFNDNKPIGFMIINKNKLEYYDINGNQIEADVKKDIKKSIKGNVLFNMDKIWIHPFINYKKKVNEINFRYTYKLYDSEKSKGLIIGNDPGYTETLIKRFSKLDLSEPIFNNLNKNFDKLYGKYSAGDKFKLIEIVFRIKNKISNDKRYFINSELNKLILK